MVADFLDGGALDELTLRRNRDDLDATLLAQRVLADISTRSTATTLLGTGLSVPLIVSPMGLLTLLHPDADVAIARASAEAGSIFIHSPWSGCSLRDVVAVAPGRVWAQIAFWKAAHETEQHIEQARAAGVDTLVIAGDVGISSKRERDMRHGTAMPPRPRSATWWMSHCIPDGSGDSPPAAPSRSVRTSSMGERSGCRRSVIGCTATRTRPPPGRTSKPCVVRGRASSS